MPLDQSLRILIALKALRLSTRLARFAVWLAPELRGRTQRGLYFDHHRRPAGATRRVFLCWDLVQVGRLGYLTLRFSADVLPLLGTS